MLDESDVVVDTGNDEFVVLKVVEEWIKHLHHVDDVSSVG